MQQYLPEWFNEQELENFMSEGFLTRQAWMKGLKRWARTKFVLRKMIGSTPAKYMSRAQRSKHAILANAAIQNAREMEAAKNSEEMMQAKRNFIRQEDVEMNFDKFLEEKFNKGSQRSFNLGVRSSAGERATEKNFTGDPKNQAKLKKREQRKDMRRRGLKVENFLNLIIEEDKKKQKDKEKIKKKEETKNKPGSKEDPEDTANLDDIQKGDLSRVLVVQTPSGAIQLITKNSNNQGNKIIAGDEKRKITSKSQLKKFLDDEKFRVTPTAKALFGEYLDTMMDKKRSDKKDIDMAKKTADKASKEVEKSVDDPFSIVPPSPEDASRSHGRLSGSETEKLFWLSDIIDGSPLAKEMKKILGQEEVEAIKSSLQNNPGHYSTAQRLRAKLLQDATASNPNLAEKELAIIPMQILQPCVEVGKLYKSLGSDDRTPTSSMVVMDVADGKKLLKNISLKSCANDVGKMGDKMYKASLKKGKAVPFSAQVKETLALFEAVQTMLREYFQGSIPMEIVKQLNMLVNEINKLVQLSRGGIGGADANVAWSLIQKAMNTNPMPTSLNSSDLQFYTNSAQIMKNMNNILDELLSSREVKAAIILQQMNGIAKFGKGSLATSDAIVTVDDFGNYTGSIPLFNSLTDALQSREFMSLVDELKIGVGRTSKNFTSSLSGRGQPGNEIGLVGGAQAQSNLMSSFDPFINNQLDNLFEYTFNPPDVTVSNLAPDNLTINDELPGASPFMSQLGQQQVQNLNPDTILSFLVQSGFIESIYANPIDFAELGMKISSSNSPVKNQITVNGRFFQIPVVNPNISETFIQDIDDLNEEMIHLVNTGFPLELAIEEFREKLEKIMEGKHRNYKKEYAKFHGKPEQRAKRSKRVLARRKMAKKLGKKAIKGKDIDHKNGNALDNSDKNLRVRSINKNRADNGHSRKRKMNETWGAGLEGSYEMTLKWLKQTPGQFSNIDPKLLKLLAKNKGKSR